jgi:hypothetical protein
MNIESRNQNYGIYFVVEVRNFEFSSLSPERCLQFLSSRSMVFSMASLLISPLALRDIRFIHSVPCFMPWAAEITGGLWGSCAL